jgi:hypothetical protein
VADDHAPSKRLHPLERLSKTQRFRSATVRKASVSTRCPTFASAARGLASAADRHFIDETHALTLPSCTAARTQQAIVGSPQRATSLTLMRFHDNWETISAVALLRRSQKHLPVRSEPVPPTINSGADRTAVGVTVDRLIPKTAAPSDGTLWTARFLHEIATVGAPANHAQHRPPESAGRR